VAFDVPAVHVRVAVVVGHHGPVLAMPGIPAGYPVQLPLQDERAVFEELILLAVHDDPAAALDGVAPAVPGTGHRGRSRPHPVLMDDALPGGVLVEAGQRRHLRAGADRPRNRGIHASVHPAASLPISGYAPNRHRPTAADQEKWPKGPRSGAFRPAVLA